MSKDFGIDNNEGGFELDETPSIEELMDLARTGEVIEGISEIDFFENEEEPEEIQEPEPQGIESIDFEDSNSNNFEVSFEADPVTDNPSYNQWEDTTQYEPNQEVESFDNNLNEFDNSFEEDDLSSILEKENDPILEEYTPQFTEESVKEEIRLAEFEQNLPRPEEEIKPVPGYGVSTEQDSGRHESKQNDEKSFAKVSIRKESEYVEETQRIIAALDTYREIDKESRAIVSQFIHNDSDADPEDEATLVVKALRADPMLEKTMVALQEAATEKDRVQRVFYVLELPQDVLYSLGDLVGTFIGEEISQSLEKIPFSRLVENGINGLDEKIISYVSATRNVLEAARSGK